VRPKNIPAPKPTITVKVPGMTSVYRIPGAIDPMNGILVRIAVDQTYGHWNAPVDEATREFVFVPIPDGEAKNYSPRCRETYEGFRGELRGFAERKGRPNDYEFGFPTALGQRAVHLDPDFRFLTYGDNGAVRGKGIGQLKSGDLLVFYSGLRSIQRPDVLVYAITGLFVIDWTTRALDILADSSASLS
jgi:Nucleotide modification associated domain 3